MNEDSYGLGKIHNYYGAPKNRGHDNNGGTRAETPEEKARREQQFRETNHYYAELNIIKDYEEMAEWDEWENPNRVDDGPHHCSAFGQTRWG